MTNGSSPTDPLGATSEDRWWRYRAVWIPLAVAVLAGVLALYGVGRAMPWADELQTLGYCLGPWRDGLYLSTHSQNMPVGYWLIAKCCLTVTGPSFTTMRVVSGVAFVGFVFLASRMILRWLPISSGLPTAVLIALHPALVWHARDGRVYSILLLAAAGSTALLLARPFRGRMLLWSVVSAAMIYLHHHAIFYVVIQSLIMIDRRMTELRWLPLVALLALPDLVFIYWGMKSPNVASQMFGAGQTFGPNLLLALDRLGAGSPEYVYGPVSPTWRKLLGVAMLAVPTVILVFRGNGVLGWMGLSVLGLLIVPAWVHDALDVFYEPRFIIPAVPLAVAFLMGSLARLSLRPIGWAVALALAGLYVVTDRQVMHPPVLPYRPLRADIQEGLTRMSGRIVMHPGYLVGCWPVPPDFDKQGRVILSDTGAMKGVERGMASGNATLYSPEMPWSRFRREVARGEPFTLIQGNPMLYPRPNEDFCRQDVPWATGYRLERLWPDHPFVAIWRFEPVPTSSRGASK